MKRVIKNKKKMKNTMYIVFGTFALLLFMITRTNPSFANEGLIIDEALDKIAEQTVPSDNVSQENESETSNETLEEDVIEPELTPDEKAVEGDESPKDLEEDDNNEDEENLYGEEVNNGENDENLDKEGKTEESDKTSETEDGDNQTEVETPEVSSDGESHGVSDKPSKPENSELDIVRETLNFEAIIGISESKGVIVNVEASENTFPEGTELKILPITIKSELNEIKGDIMDSDQGKNIIEKSEIVAFDISFIYTLSNGEQIELQPKDNTVKVTFNYEDNKDLSKADNNEDQEIKIFHIEEVIDEEGNKTGEKEIKEVTNKEESVEDGIVVADAESFSIYAVIRSEQIGPITVRYIANTDTVGCNGVGGTFANSATYLNVTYTDANNDGIFEADINVQAPNRAMVNGTGWMFDGWYTNNACTTEWYGVVSDTTVQNMPTEVYAKYLPFEDLVLNLGDSKFTIMDRNLGATDVAKGLHKTDNNNSPEASGKLGKYYQWGNNYGFATASNDSKWIYTSDKQIVNTTGRPRGPGNYYSSAVFIYRPDGVYNMKDRTTSDDAFNRRGGKIGKDEAKQGPCPRGYHVPSREEWNNLYSAFNEWKIDEGTTFCGNYSSVERCFAAKLKLPYAGSRRLYSEGIVAKQGEDGTYTTTDTDTYGNVHGRSMSNLGGWDVLGIMAGLSVRCFKNAPIVTYVSDGEVVAIQGSNETIPNLTKDRYDFLGWYDNPKFTGSPVIISSIIEDITLYARWECDSNSTEVNGECVPLVTVTFDSNGGSEIDPQVIISGNLATQPATNPTRDNSVFKWWYLENPETAFDFEYTAITGDITLNANWKCNSGYIEKGEACVESVVVKFNTNGGSSKGSIEIEKGTKLKQSITKYSHTSNISDSGVQSGDYPGSQHWSQIVTISGADTLHVTLTYGTESNWDFLYVFKGVYTGSVTRYLSAGQIYTYNGNEDSPVTTGFDIEGDTATFSFYSDSVDQYYGYYASIEGSYDKIGEAPTNERGTFVGWYLSGSDTLFDPESTNITGDTTLYAKWLCNGGYIELGGECIEPKNTVILNYYANGGTSATSGSVEVVSGDIINLSLYTGTKTGWKFVGWNINSGATEAMANPTVTAPMTLYAIFKKEGITLTGTIIPNGATVTSTEITCNIPTIYNNQSEVTECTLNFPTATRTNGTVYGYSTTNTQTETPAIENGGTINISASTSFYVISKEILTGTFYLNGNTSQTPNGGVESTAESVTETCNLWNTETECNITTPTYVPANGKIAKGYTTVADVSNQSDPTFISTGTLISLTTSTPYYAQSKSDDNILHVTYLSGAGVQSIGKDSDSCILTGTWNSISQAAECAVKAPTITLKAGYKAGIWTTGNITKNPGDDIILIRDDTYTARAINNTDTQYHVNYYKENLDGTYDLFETWTGYGTTDTQAIVTGTDKSYVGFSFSGTNANNVTSGNIDGDGSRVLSLYYDRIEYKLNFVVDENIIQSGNVKYEADITVPVNPKKECNEFSGWTSSVDGLTTTGTMPDSDVTFTANWNYICSRSSGGGAKKSETTTREIAIDTNTENEHNSADEKENNAETSEVDKTTLNDETSNQVISVTQEVSEDGTVEAVVETVKIRNTDIIATVRTEVNSSNSSSSSSSSTTHTKEQKDAYSFAKSNGITTTKSIETAKMDTELTRIQMAKMVSNYAINVLGQEPDTSKGTVEFKDVTEEMDKQYDNAVTKTYQLGIMGQNINDDKFRPNDEVSRAEFSATLSRLLYHTEEGKYKGTGKYYVPHIVKLYNEGIINKVIPTMKERRGYVMTMLMRTVK